MFAASNFFLGIQKTVSAFMVMVLSIGYSLGLSFDFQGVYYDRSSVVSYCFYDSTKKVAQDEFIGKTAAYDIRLARNEFEACQIAIRSKFNSPTRLYTIEFAPFVNDAGEVLESTVYTEKYIMCDSDKYYGKFPDALIPVEGAQQVILNCQKNWLYYIQVHAHESTPAGTYHSSVKVTNNSEDGKVEFIADLTATVWNFTLPETPTCDTAFGLGRGNIAKMHGTVNNPQATQELYEQYYEYLVLHKISPYSLPYDILDSRADAYMSDPRVKSFLIPYPGSDELLQQYYAKVCSNPEWAKKGYFYPIDEPASLEAYESYTQITDRLGRLCPGYNMVTPANCASFTENGETYYTSDLQSGRSNIMCGISNVYDLKEFREQAEIMRDNGAKLWWYVCCGPKGDYCNIFIHWEGIKGRLLLWQQKSLDIEGLLYWDTTYWTDVISPWADALTTPWTGNDTFGDGSLFYNGENGPVSTLRLQEVSDGIDDFEYLTIAEELFGREYVDKKIAKVSNSLTDYTLNDALLASVRVEIGNDIEAATAEQ